MGQLCKLYWPQACPLAFTHQTILVLLAKITKALTLGLCPKSKKVNGKIISLNEGGCI